MIISGEQPSLPSSDQDRLSLSLRNAIQQEILLGMPPEEQSLWVENYAAEAAEIMDGNTEVGKQIRQFARDGKIEEAAELLKQHLPQLQEVDW